MATAAALNVILRAKSAVFDKAMKRSGKRVKTFSGTVQRANRLMSTFGVALGAGGAVLGLRKLIMAASDAEEIASKFAAVFKEQSAAAQAFGDDLAKAVGRSRAEMQKYLATMQDTFVPLGFARKQAREMAQEITKLAVDLASFNNVADASALRDLQSAIVGNHETMRKYGVIITQATLDQKLLAMGFNKVSKGATEQQKALARMQVILASTTDAQGDALRTAGSFANQMRALKAAVADLAVAFGQALMPTVKQWIIQLNRVATRMKSLTQDDVENLVRKAKLLGAVLVSIWIAPKLIGGMIGFIKLAKRVTIALRAVTGAAVIAKASLLAIPIGFVKLLTKAFVALKAAILGVVALPLIALTAGLGAIGIHAWRSNKKLKELESTMLTFGDATRAAAKARDELTKAQTTAAEAGALEKLATAQERMAELVRAEGTDVGERLAAGFERIARETRALIPEITETVADAISLVQKVEEKLNELARKAALAEGMITARDIALVDLEKLGATNDQLDEAIELMDRLEAATKKAAFAKAGKAVFEATRTSLEMFETELGRLSELLNQGALDWDTYGRAIRAAIRARDVGPTGRGPGEFRTFAAGAMDIRGLGTFGQRDPKLDEQKETNVILEKVLKIMREEASAEGLK